MRCAGLVFGGQRKETQPARELLHALEPSGPLPPRPRRFGRAAAVEAGLADTAAAAAGAAALFLAPPSGWEYAGRADTAPVPPLPPLPALRPVPAPADAATLWTPGTKEGALPTKPRSEGASAAFSLKD